jgi:hypothetical protein
MVFKTKISDKDSFKGRKCECCGHSDYLAGVASSPLGAFSILWCQICLKMNANPKWSIDALFEMDNWRIHQMNADDFIYYDPEHDNYIAYGSQAIIYIKLKDGTQFKNRTEAIKFLNKQGI